MDYDRSIVITKHISHLQKAIKLITKYQIAISLFCIIHTFVQVIYNVRWSTIIYERFFLCFVCTAEWTTSDIFS